MDCYCYHLHLCTSLHLWTLLFCIYGLCYYYCCCTVCTVLLFSHSAIFIAASVRNKLIHSFIRYAWVNFLSGVASDVDELSSFWGQKVKL